MPTFSASFRLTFVAGLALLSLAAAAQPTRPAYLAVPGASAWPAGLGEALEAGGLRAPHAPTLRPASPADIIVAQQAVMYAWDSIRWVTPIRRIMTYDAAARLIGVETSDSLTGGNRGRQRLTYNAAGQLTEWFFEGDVSGTWQPLDRYVYTYDVRGNQTSFRNELWDAGRWQLRDGSEHTYVYTAAGQIAEDVERWYDPNIGQIVNLTRTSYTYVGGPQWNTQLRERWNPVAGVWNMDRRFVDPVYDTNPVPRLLSCRIQGWTGTAFTDIDRATITWDPDGGWVELRERYDPVQGWQNNWRVINDLNIYGDQLEWRIDRWDATSGWLIEYGERSISIYRPTGERVRETQQRFNLVEGQYLHVNLINYSNFRTIPLGLPAEAGAARMQLYPNPTAGPLTLEAPADAIAATVRDALGRVVQTVRVAPQAGRVALDLSALPAGVYAVGLQAAGGTVVRRVVRQ